MRFLRNALLLVVIALPVQAATLYVSKDGDGTDGLSWATGFQTISDALIASSTGDDIWVKEATYEETLTLRSGVRIFGGFQGSEDIDEFDERDWQANKTTLEEVQSEELAVDAIDVQAAVLDGLELQFRDRQFLVAIDCRGATSSLTIRNCTVRDDDPIEIGTTTIVSKGAFLRFENTLMIRISPSTGGSLVVVGKEDGFAGTCVATTRRL